MGSCWLCGSECSFFDSSPFFMVGVLQLVSKKRHHYCMVTNLSEFFFIFLFLVSCTIFSCFWWAVLYFLVSGELYYIFLFLVSCTIFSLFVYTVCCHNVNFAQHSPVEYSLVEYSPGEYSLNTPWLLKAERNWNVYICPCAQNYITYKPMFCFCIFFLGCIFSSQCELTYNWSSNNKQWSDCFVQFDTNP